MEKVTAIAVYAGLLTGVVLTAYACHVTGHQLEGGICAIILERLVSAA